MSAIRFVFLSYWCENLEWNGILKKPSQTDKIKRGLLLWLPSLCQRYISCEAQAPFYVTGVLGATHAEIEHHLEMGRKLLAAGQLAEALSHYHSAVGKITQGHTHWHTFMLSPLADIFILRLCSANALPLLYLHLSTLTCHKITSFSIDEKFSVLDILQRETLRITWPSTSELRCSWRWENPNPPFQTWPEPSSSSLISWLWVHLITTRKTNSHKKTNLKKSPYFCVHVLIMSISYHPVFLRSGTFRPGCREGTSF